LEHCPLQQSEVVEHNWPVDPHSQDPFVQTNVQQSFGPPHGVPVVPQLQIPLAAQLPPQQSPSLLQNWPAPLHVHWLF
jgi:hypothetical protein